ncbi:MAG TPA: hypothetical protein ENK48_01880 [Gammaproteobacteria bacterium]|nr:hypothetical protein [Gammaproteobacteria bacterium]
MWPHHRLLPNLRDDLAKVSQQIACVVFIFLVSVSGQVPARERPEVEVADPYLELHTGPGAAYPVFYVVERGARVKVLKRRTDWFKVRTLRGREGWVARDQMERTLVAAGVRLHIKEAGQGDFSARRWEMGVLGGDFEGADSITLYGGYAFTPNLSAELSVAQILGDFSDSLLVNVDLLAQPFPRWRASPFFSLGTGVIDTRARKTVVAAEDSTDQVSHVGAGVRIYLGRRFILRAGYRNYVIFTSRNDNVEIDQWRAGFAFFF